MLQKALVLVFVLASLAGCIGCSNTASQYVYATVPVENQILAYREDPNSGVLNNLRVTSTYSLQGPATWCLVDGRTS